MYLLADCLTIARRYLVWVGLFQASVTFCSTVGQIVRKPRGPDLGQICGK